MALQQTVEEIEILIRSRYGLVVIDSWEDDRIEEALRRVAADLSLHFHRWRRSKGVVRGGDHGDPYADDTAEPVQALAHAEREGAGIYYFPGLGEYLQDPVVAWRVRDVVDRFEIRRGALVISGTDVRLPEHLQPFAVFLRLPGPAYDEYRALLDRVLRDHQARMPIRVDLTIEERSRLLHNLAGLSLTESERILNRILIEDAALTAEDIAGVTEGKRKVVEQDRVLEFWPAEEDLSSVAGLEGLKQWLEKRRAVVDDPDGAERAGLPFPRGMLLLGVPGCGKSLCAKAVAREWRLPLLRLDPGTLYDKYVGDSEKNFRRAVRMAERMAPAVLWIDELEKAFTTTSGEQDGGVSQRVFGSFLSWLQERRGDVFVVATSNDVSRLPPEFIRKGRFDEVFFVDLPDRNARRLIFEIHLRKRRVDTSRLDLDQLAALTSGFSGAEIEQVVISALFSAFAAKQPVETAIIHEEIAATTPLSRTMAERLTSLREWARDRTVNADGRNGRPAHAPSLHVL